MDFKPYIEVSAALLTPLIALITTYIAIQQYRSNKAKLRHELYDKRLAVYKATMRFMMYASMSKPLDSELDSYLSATGEAPFLFDKGLSEFLHKLYYKGLEKKELETDHKESTLEKGHMMILEIRDIERWFDDHKNLAHEKFVKYLDLKNLK